MTIHSNLVSKIKIMYNLVKLINIGNKFDT